MLPSTRTVKGVLLFDENEAILMKNFLIIFVEVKRPVRNENCDLLN